VVAVFVVLVGGIIASTREAARARLAEHSAVASKLAADRGRDRALAAEAQAEDASRQAADSEARARQDRDQAVREKQRADLESATAKAVSEFLQRDVLAQAGNNVQATPDSPPDPDLKIRTALDRAAGRIEGKFEGQPLVEASIRETIGNAYQDLGLYTESQRQLEHALEIRRRHLGEDDARTMAVRLQLGTLLALKRQYAQSEPVFATLLPLQRRKLGNRHPQTLATMVRLARSYIGQQKFVLAEPLLAEALEGQSQTMGEDHRETLETRQALGQLYAGTNRRRQAEQIFAGLIETSHRANGEEHPFTVGTMNMLGNLYSAAERYADAERTYLQVQAIQKRVRGEEHPNSLNTMASLAALYLRQERDAEAMPLLVKLAATAPRVLGQQDSISRFSLVQLAVLARKERRYAEAEPLWSKVIEIRRFGARADTPALANLGFVRIQLGKYAEAEPVIREALTADEKNLPGSWDILRDRLLLGASLAGQTQFADAEPLLIAGFEGLLRRKNGMPPESRFWLDDAGPLIVRLYQDWGKPDQAAAWTRRLRETKAGSPR
jgi:tetratricopeptide (TPR) repeat protein